MPGGSVGRGSDCAPKGAEGRELGGQPDRHPLSRGMTRPRRTWRGLSALGSRLSALLFRCHRSLPGSRLRFRPNRRNTALYLRIFPNCPYSFPTGRHRTGKPPSIMPIPRTTPCERRYMVRFGIRFALPRQPPQRTVPGCRTPSHP